MKKRILAIVCMSALVMPMLTGCGSEAEAGSAVESGLTASAAAEVAETAIEMVEEAVVEAPHEHSFTETITKEATCLEAGEKALTCECGESSVEEVPATGHDFSNYVSNEDATYEADGTETATCECGETDTRVAEGSMLTYTFEDMDATKYAKSTVNVRSLPISDGEKLGGLAQNDEVRVTGKCVETGWFRIEYSDGIAYVSNDYLVDNKVEVQAQSTSEAFPYEFYKVYNDGNVAWIYAVDSMCVPKWSDAYIAVYDEACNFNRARYTVVDGQCPEYDAAVQAVGGNGRTSWYVNGERVYKVFAF